MEGPRRTAIVITVLVVAAVALGLFALFNWQTAKPEAPAAKPEAVINSFSFFGKVTAVSESGLTAVKDDQSYIINVSPATQIGGARDLADIKVGESVLVEAKEIIGKATTFDATFINVQRLKPLPPLENPQL